MLIWGTTRLKSAVGSGIFNCPNCESESPYTKKKATEFFTLYFIPVFPIASRGHVIECDVCRGSFAEQILNYDPEAEQIANQASVFRILIAFMVHFKKTTVQHVAACREAYSRLLDQDVPVEIVERELQLALEPSSNPVKYIQTEGVTFAIQARVQIILSARKIVLAEPVDEEHLKMVLKEFSLLLGFRANEFGQLYRMVSQVGEATDQPV